MDLSKVTFPTFVLEPRSMLERITDFMSHPDLIFDAEQLDDPTERFIKVLAYYLSGWHIKPKGVKKPYNPVLGEFFRCTYNYSNGTKGYYVAEQVSHHPPISAYFYISPANNIKIVGELRPKSKFLGNSVSTIMEGENRVSLLGRPDDGEYIITMPNMYARGIVFGKMVLELGETCTAKNAANDILADIDFKTKGFFSGTYNAVNAKLRRQGSEFAEVTGRWNKVMEIKDVKGKSVLFDADAATVAEKSVCPIDEQDPNESRRLWRDVTAAIDSKNMEAATEAKSAIEDAQREARRKREESGQQHVPRFFEFVDDRWLPKLRITSGDTSQVVEAVRQFIWP